MAADAPGEIAGRRQDVSSGADLRKPVLDEGQRLSLEMSPRRRQNTVPRDADDLIKAVVAKTDLERDEVEDRVEEELENLKANLSSEMDDDTLRGHAASVVKNDLLNITGGGGFGGGETVELPILSLGYQNKEGDYFVTSDDAILASGIVNPPDDPAGFCTIIIDSDHGVDLDHVRDAFTPLNTVRAAAAIRQVGSRDGEPTIKKGGNPTYVINSTDKAKFEVVDPDSVDDEDPISELPADREAKREMIHSHFITEEEHITLQDYAEHESATNNNGYEVAFGVDVKRIRGEVVDSMVFDSGDGVMTVMDDTVVDEDDVPEELISDRMRTPGLQLQVAGELVLGENSVVDAYGFIQQRDEGHYQMQCLGLIPIVEFEYDGPDGGGGGNDSPDDDHEEDTI